MVQPVQRFKAGACIASVFPREVKTGEETAVLYSVSLQRVYKDTDGQFRYATSLKLNDLPKAILVLEQAYAYILSAREEK